MFSERPLVVARWRPDQRFFYAPGYGLFKASWMFSLKQKAARGLAAFCLGV
jgi:hypothetical protein